MNDFSELENELKKLRPAPPSPVLFQRVGEAIAEDCRPSISDAKREFWRRLTQTPYNWLSLGVGLAAAAALAVFAVISFQFVHERREGVAQSSLPQPETRTAPRGIEQSTAPDRFVSAGGAHVVYNARDEGLQFANGFERPVRRVRYRTQQTWQWRNPGTGASLRVSYPSEEIVLIPVSGQ
jgi:uncharacterized iron-regulated membrane protein